MTAGEREAIVDEFGELARQLAQSKPLRERFKALSLQIQSWYEDKPAEETFTAEGARYSVQVSMRQIERKVTNKGWLYKWLTRDRFIEHASIDLGTIDKLVPKVWHGRFLTSARTGHRSVIAVATAAINGTNKVAA